MHVKFKTFSYFEFFEERGCFQLEEQTTFIDFVKLTREISNLRNVNFFFGSYRSHEKDALITILIYRQPSVWGVENHPSNYTDSARVINFFFA